MRLGAGAAATTHGLSARVAGSRVPAPRKKGPGALMCKSSDRPQAGGQRPSVRSQGRGTALGTRAQTDGLYRPGLASPVDRHQSSAPSSNHLDGERCATSRASRASLHSSCRTTLPQTPMKCTNHAPARGFLKATQRLNQGFLRPFFHYRPRSGQTLTCGRKPTRRRMHCRGFGAASRAALCQGQARSTSVQSRRCTAQPPRRMLKCKKKHR